MTELRNFYDAVIKPIALQSPNEVLFLFTQARRKYSPDLAAHDPLTNRTLLRLDDWDYFYGRVSQHIAGADCSYYRPALTNHWLLVPAYSTVTYLDLRPKSIISSYKACMTRFVDQLTSYASNPSDHFLLHPDKLVLSEIHKANARKPLAVIDVDEQDDYPCFLLTKSILELLDYQGICWVTRTHGGYHIIVDLSVVDCKLLFGQILNAKDGLFVREMAASALDTIQWATPVPGTLQSDHPVVGVPLNDFLLKTEKWSPMIGRDSRDTLTVEL